MIGILRASWARFLILNAGESAFLESEQLRFEQGVGDRAAVDGHEGLLVPRTPAVDGPRDQFLARAALTRDQHIALAGCGLLDNAEDLLHGCAVADDLIEAEFVAQDPLLVPGDHLGQDLGGKRFFQVVRGTQAHGLDGLLQMRAGKNDDRHAVTDVEQPVLPLQGIEVEKREVMRLFPIAPGRGPGANPADRNSAYSSFASSDMTRMFSIRAGDKF
jgi:hypothetical protein